MVSVHYIYCLHSIICHVNEITVVQTDVKRRLDDVMADIKRLSTSVQQKLKGFVSSVCADYVLVSKVMYCSHVKSIGNL